MLQQELNVEFQGGAATCSWTDCSATPRRRKSREQLQRLPQKSEWPRKVVACLHDVSLEEWHPNFGRGASSVLVTPICLVVSMVRMPLLRRKERDNRRESPSKNKSACASCLRRPRHKLVMTCNRVCCTTVIYAATSVQRPLRILLGGGAEAEGSTLLFKVPKPQEIPRAMSQTSQSGRSLQERLSHPVRSLFGGPAFGLAGGSLPTPSCLQVQDSSSKWRPCHLYESRDPSNIRSCQHFRRSHVIRAAMHLSEL